MICSFWNVMGRKKFRQKQNNQPSEDGVTLIVRDNHKKKAILESYATQGAKKRGRNSIVIPGVTPEDLLAQKFGPSVEVNYQRAVKVMDEGLKQEAVSLKQQIEQLLTQSALQKEEYERKIKDLEEARREARRGQISTQAQQKKIRTLEQELETAKKDLDISRRVNPEIIIDNLVGAVGDYNEQAYNDYETLSELERESLDEVKVLAEMEFFDFLLREYPILEELDITNEETLSREINKAKNESTGEPNQKRYEEATKNLKFYAQYKGNEGDLPEALLDYFNSIDPETEKAAVDEFKQATAIQGRRKKLLELSGKLTGLKQEHQNYREIVEAGEGLVDKEKFYLVIGLEGMPAQKEDRKRYIITIYNPMKSRTNELTKSLEAVANKQDGIPIRRTKKGIELLYSKKTHSREKICAKLGQLVNELYENLRETDFCKAGYAVQIFPIGSFLETSRQIDGIDGVEEERLQAESMKTPCDIPATVLDAINQNLEKAKRREVYEAIVKAIGEGEMPPQEIKKHLIGNGMLDEGQQSVVHDCLKYLSRWGAVVKEGRGQQAGYKLKVKD